jgi:acetolactate synthase-1/2/3 large subunit
MPEIRCATAIIKTLEAIGMDTAFVYNGHGNWALLDALKHESRINGIACRGEELGVHMADGYYRAKRNGSVALVSTSVGPGNMNIASALANAFFESSAMVVLAGAGATHWYDRGGIEEFYRYAPDEWIQTVKHYTKKALVVNRPDTAVEMLLRAYKTAVTERPGPVVLQMPFDIQHSNIEFNGVADLKKWVDIHPPGPDRQAIREAARLIAKAQKPLVFVSSGIHRANAFAELSMLLESFGIPLVTTTMGKGVYPENRPLCLGAIGRAGTGHANKAAGECDLVIAIGTHFTDIDTGGWTLFNIPQKTRLIHIDIDPCEICRVYPAEVGIISDAKLALAALNDELKSLGAKSSTWASWVAEINKWRKEWEESVAEMAHSNQAPLNYARLCHDVSEVINQTCPETSVFVDTGHLLSFAPPFYKALGPNFYHNGVFHRMGWSLAAAMGARVARPDQPSVALIGDGSFLFSCQTLATAYEYDLPVTAVVLNNKSLQLEREVMNRMYGRISFVDYVKKSSGELWNPDIVAIAKAMGAQAEKVRSPQELAPAMKKALESSSSYVIDVDIDIDAPGYRSVWYRYPNNFWVPLTAIDKHF